ncbi:TMhelix containing protein [Vibrio phage 2.117.O._10N.261.45.E9]|nr:TMhelix containing protein [Vibrio phage 1.117.O._10N.261.45.E9]AUR95423.1 TMhelix containing protein [Vibrio phage 1.207.B._10N.222.51.C2]AUS02314.1 TMhelix containing protein [Vibrio phage 2.117.O._10N.261.45.E9]
MGKQMGRIEHTIAIWIVNIIIVLFVFTVLADALAGKMGSIIGSIG